MTAKVYFDTNVFVEAFERVDQANSTVWPILNAAERGEFRPVTSEITYCELLPKLIYDGEAELISLYEQLFSAPSVFEPLPITREVLAEAAHLRAGRMSLRLPDAIHLATAVTSNCVVVLSNDARLGSIGQVPVVPLAQDSLSRLRDYIR